MDVQYKLFQIFDVEEKEKIKKETKENYIEIFDNIIAIKYEMHQYNSLLESFYKYNCKQYILTSRLFYSVIEIIFQSGYRLNDIGFLENIDENLREEVDIRLNKLYEKEEVNLTKFLEILKIFNMSEGIDIAFIKVKLNDPKIRKKIKIFNNGIIYSDSKIEDQLLFLLKNSIKAVV